MLKLRLLYLVLLFTCFGAIAQSSHSNLPRELSLKIQQSKPDTSRIGLLLALGKYYVDKPDENKKDLDSAYISLGQAMKLSDALKSVEWHNKTLELTAYCDEQAGNLQHAKIRFIQLIDYYHKINNKQQEAESWTKLGKLMPADNKDNIQYKIQCFENARSIFQQANNKPDAITSSQNIAEAHFNDGKLEQAESEMTAVLAQYKAIGYKKLNNTYDILAEINKSKPDLHKELFYRLELVKGMEQTADTAQADYYYSKLALVYSDLAMYEQSLTEILKSAEIVKRRKTFGDFYGYLSLIMYDFISEGKPAQALSFLQKSVKEVPPENLAQQVDMNEEFANCYKSMKNYAKAEQYYLEMVRLFKITSFNKDYYSTNEQMVVDYTYYYQTLGAFYLQTKQFDKAGFYVNKILLLPKDAIRPISLRKILLMKFRVDSASGNYVSAINYFEKYKNLNDSLFNDTKSKQIAELQIKYQTDQKEQAIKVLNSQSIAQHAELQKVNLERNITFGGVAMLLIISGVAYNGYRNKQRSNLQLQIKQKEINQQNTALQHLLIDKDKLLTEKDWLLKEVHHRVKNNLQIVMSLLSTQSAYLKNNAALAAIRESQNRVQAISLIHQRLYKTSNVASINMPVYITELTNYLRDSFNTTERSIRFELLIESVQMDLSQAIPVGLILNEAITNAIKYAFDTKGGEVVIALQMVEKDTVLMTISDNGKGLPADFDIQSANSLGMEMMKALSKQLGGDFNINNKKGTVISIEFQVEKVIHNITTENLVHT